MRIAHSHLTTPAQYTVTFYLGDVIHDGHEEERGKSLQSNCACAVASYLCDVIHDGGEEERDNTMEVGVAVRTGSQPAAY